MRSKTEKGQNANSKVEIKYFSIVDYDKEQEYLRRMHKSGWKLTRVSGICVYHFEKCEPEDVIYQLDYNQEGIEHKSEYLQLFADCGWEYIQDYVGYSYFCDDESRREMLRRVFTGRLLPLAVIFGILLLPQFISVMFVERDYVAGVILGVMVGLYIAIFAAFAIKYVGYMRKK